MWIRTQDKFELVKTDYIFVDENEVQAIKENKAVLLGQYKSEERALEVLDMIQTRIIKGTTFDYINKSKRTTKEFVVQMPKE